MKCILSSILRLFLSFLVFSQKEKPNILMIAIEDLNDWEGVYGGHLQAITPNIDKLATKGMADYAKLHPERKLTFIHRWHLVAFENLPDWHVYDKSVLKEYTDQGGSGIPSFRKIKIINKKL